MDLLRIMMKVKGNLPEVAIIVSYEYYSTTINIVLESVCLIKDI